MITFNFHNAIYKFPETLSEITLGKFIDYQEKIEVFKPKSLVEFEERTNPEDRKKLAEDETSIIVIVNEWLPFLVKFIVYWTNMPNNVATLISVHEAFWLYSVINQNINSFVFDAEKRSFNVGEQSFEYPKRPINKFTGEKEYLKGTRIIEVIEAFQFELYADQLSKSKFGALPYIIGILCRKENEPLPIDMEQREEFISQRAEIMKELPLDEALNFSFFLPTLNNILKNDSVLYGKLHSTAMPEQEHTVPRFGSVTGGLR